MSVMFWFKLIFPHRGNADLTQLGDQFWLNTRIYIHTYISITFHSFKQNAYLGKNPIPFDNVPCVNLLSRKKKLKDLFRKIKNQIV